MSYAHKHVTDSLNSESCRARDKQARNSTELHEHYCGLTESTEYFEDLDGEVS
jgi:hypothetical protein